MPQRRKPVSQKILEGSFRKDREIKNELQLKPGKPVMPRWLTREARRKWKEIVKELQPRGVLTKLDATMLTIFCGLWAEYVAGQQPGGKPMTPAKIAQMRLLGNDYGLTPPARAKIPAATEDRGFRWNLDRKGK